jgi:hypothetical protein
MHLQVSVALEHAQGDEGATGAHAETFLGAAIGAAGPYGPNHVQ